MVCLWRIGNEIVDRRVEIGVKNSLNSQSDSFLHVIWVHVTLHSHAVSVIIFFADFFKIFFDIPLMFQSFFINFVATVTPHAFKRIKMENLKLYIYSRLSLTPPRHSIFSMCRYRACMDGSVGDNFIFCDDTVAVDCVAFVYRWNFWYARCCGWTFLNFHEITALNYLTMCCVLNELALQTNSLSRAHFHVRRKNNKSN